MEERSFNEFVPHSDKQHIALFSDKPVVVLACGIQFGKTSVGAVKTQIKMWTHRDASDNFLIVAPTYKIMQQSTLPEFLRRMDGFGTYSKGDAIFKMHNGGTVYFRTATDADSIVGVTNVRFIWGDEAGLFSLYFWENMQARAAFKQAQILLTTSPYTMNWLYKDIIRPFMKGRGSPDVELIQAASNENPYFPQDVWERNKKTMDTRRFNSMFGGEWDKMEGLVYDIFDEADFTVEPFQLPKGTKYYGGIDWGYTNPFAMTVRAVTPDGMHYQVSEHYERGLTIQDMVHAARQKQQIWGIERWYCDPSAPGNIEEFCRAGLSAVGADNDIRLGVDMHYHLMKSGKYKLFKGANKYSIDEYETYHYPDDEDQRGPNQDHRERLPVKRSDHLMDCIRYITRHTYRNYDLQPTATGDELIDAKREETYEERMARLRRPSVDTMTERWD